MGWNYVFGLGVVLTLVSGIPIFSGFGVAGIVGGSVAATIQ